jgi:hypothetical protein
MTPSSFGRGDRELFAAVATPAVACLGSLLVTAAQRLDETGIGWWLLIRAGSARSGPGAWAQRTLGICWPTWGNTRWPTYD